MGMVLNKFFAFYGFMGMFFAKIHLFVTCFNISVFKGMTFRKFPDL